MHMRRNEKKYHKPLSLEYFNLPRAFEKIGAIAKIFIIALIFIFFGLAISYLQILLWIGLVILGGYVLYLVLSAFEKGL